MSRGGYDLENLMKIQQKIIPEATGLLERRYRILRMVLNNQPIGRRLLAQKLDLGERLVRGEIEFLRVQNLVSVSVPGVTITEEGVDIQNRLKDYVMESKGLDEIERILMEELGYSKVIIVPGDMDLDPNVKKELGRACASYVSGLLHPKDIIALTGGSTIKAFVSAFPTKEEYRDIVLVPARGSLGKNLDLQSNTLVASLAEKLSATYRLLNVPDNISRKTLEAFRQEQEIMEVVDMISRATILVVGIGRADEMAQRRGMSEEDINNLINLGALGEAFGTYFARNGKIVKKAVALGMNIEDAKEIPHLIAISGGSSKGEAIASVRFENRNAALITDEGAARDVVKVIRSR